MKSIDDIRQALSTIHNVAMGGTGAYMSIPPDMDRDADMVLMAAIDELEELRATVAGASLCSAEGACSGHCAFTGLRGCDAIKQYLSDAVLP